MIQIRVDVVQKCNMLSKWLWTVLWGDFLDVAIDQLFPIVSGVRKRREVRLISSYSYLSMSHLAEIRVDSLAPFEMSNTRGNMEAG